MSSLPWLCDGDFNEILHLGEKDGGVERPRYLMTNFRNTLNDCMLQDLGFAAPRFTWCTGRKNQDFVQERLDRFVSSLDWQQLFPFLVVSHLDSWGSNHRPILVDFRGSGNNCVDESKGGGRFHFKEIWTDYPECGEIVSSSWSGGRVSGSLADVASKISVCAESLFRWKSNTVKALRRRISAKRKELYNLNRMVDSVNSGKINRVERDLDVLLYKEERYWRQRSRVSWLRCGDRNTRFFRNKATGRQRRNRIYGLLDSEDIWRTEHGHMAGLIQNYFQQIFTSSNPYAGDFNNVLQAVGNQVIGSLLP
ncbi:hypothetical protein ACOSP7_031106 [Xanthoceras sorbifolium]